MAVRVERTVEGLPEDEATRRLEVVATPKQSDYERGVYGEKKTQFLYLNQLVTLTQVRNAPNIAAKELEESIANELINQIDVARMTVDGFKGYVDFVNTIWGVENDPSIAPVSPDGYIYLVIAGHTRYEVMRSLEAKRPADMPTEDPNGPKTECKIHDSPTPHEILHLQLDENIYRKPPEERRAMAIVEAYFYGLENGQWENKADFLRQNHRFSHSTIDDALHFANLPADIRDFVMAGGISYRAGVELGKVATYFCEYLLVQYFNNRKIKELSDEEKNKLKDGILEWLGGEVAHIQNEGRKKMNTTTLKSRYANMRRDFENVIARANGEEADGQQFMMASVNGEFELQRRRWRDRYASLVAKVAKQPLDDAAELMELHLNILKRDESEVPGILADLESDYLRRLGTLSTVVELAQ